MKIYDKIGKGKMANESSFDVICSLQFLSNSFLTAIVL